MAAKHTAQILFLPGASGDPDFWRPVAEGLTVAAEKVFVTYPGFGSSPADPHIQSLDDLVAAVAARIDRPTALVAQSMGGVIALRTALANPALVTHLVLTATSGGLDVRALGGADWRPAFAAANPSAPRWFLDDATDLSSRLREIKIPALLLWGDADPISPPAVGKRLEELLLNAELHVLVAGTHDVAKEEAPTVAWLIDSFLADEGYLRVRAETPADAAAIRAVTAAAFENAPHAEGTEPAIVAALRQAGALTVSLVAEWGGTLVGHVAVSPVTISDGTPGWYGLGPLSVLPAWQDRGIGSRLMREALQLLQERGAAGCVVLGNPAYYGRFGFKADPRLVLPGVPPEYFQAVAFAGGFPTGTVRYHEGFSARK